MKAGYTYHPIYLEHDTGQHPENARRLEAIMAHLEQTGIVHELTAIEPRPATTEELALVHTEEHVKHLREMAQRGGGWLDPDTMMSSRSYDAALYAAGGVIRAVETVMKAETSSAFAVVRPPGHHATSGRAMGFCLLNNVAIGAKYALSRCRLERIAIIDFDVHHGNGTQGAFYDNPNVLYISTHQHPHYPGTGAIGETGNGEAAGTTINIPLTPGCGDAEYEQVFEQVIVPATRRFQPQFILVSAGYDAHWADQLAMMQVTVSGFATMVKIIKQLADELCSGRTIYVLEGGYNLTVLAASVKATFDVMLGRQDIDDPLGQPSHKTGAGGISDILKAVKRIHTLA